MDTGEMFDRAMRRPPDYEKLSPESQWAIDASLGILDWDGDCPHDRNICDDCWAAYAKRFGKKPRKVRKS